MRRNNGPMVFEVDSILDECVMNYQMHYLIKWKNRGHQWDSWQPLSNLRPILAYLKDWIKKRQAKNEEKKGEKGQNYKAIKHFLYNGQFLSKKKSKYAKISTQILNRKKTWEKYIGNDGQVDDEYLNQEQKFIRNRQREMHQVLNNNGQKSEQIEEEIFYEDEEAQETGKSEQQQEYKPNENPESIIEQLNDTHLNQENELPKTQPKASTDVVTPPQQPPQQKKRPKRQKNKPKQQNDDDYFQVIGSIDMKHIVKIVRTFMKGNTRILEVLMRDGKLFFTKAEQVRKANSQMLVEFFQDHNIKF